jgi:transcriptional regulator with XRE-family HTH domain
MPDSYPTLPQLVNDLFKRYRHPDGREYTHKEVEEGITKRAGEKLIDASYISKIRTGYTKKPSIEAVEALCHFFPVETDYFFPRVVALRSQQANKPIGLTQALRRSGADPVTLKAQLLAILRGLEEDEDQ